MRANRGRSATNARRLIGAFVASILLLGVVPAMAATTGNTKGDLEVAKRQLATLETQIQAAESHLAEVQQQEADARARLATLQGQLNDLAVKIDHAQNAYDATKGQMVETQQALQATKAKYAALRNRLDHRARIAYEMGPASSLGVILGSTNVGQLSDRLEFVDQLSALDGDLAAQVQNHANDLAAERAQLQDISERQAAALQDLGNQQAALDAKFNEAKGIYADLASKAADAAAIESDLRTKANQADALVAQLQQKLKAEQLAAAREAARRAREAARKAREQQQQQQSGGDTGGGTTGGGTTGGGSTGGGSTGGGDTGGGSGGTTTDHPFSNCPVDQPHAYGDSFGAPRYAGGYHPHAGNDIMAPEGTPIRATFDGVATADANGLGGNAVIVTGAEGWTYNAHMVSYGTLGSVSAGTVIGYVGNTGDAAGGPTHDHFEWHPNVIPANPYRSVYGYTVINGAIDPYPYLNQVC
jgi:peptidoglycan hydrolase CwlO-like protein